jgi:hypothetical protein
MTKIFCKIIKIMVMKMRIFNQVRGLELTEILIIGNKLKFVKI